MRISAIYIVVVQSSDTICTQSGFKQTLSGRIDDIKILLKHGKQTNVCFMMKLTPGIVETERIFIC